MAGYLGSLARTMWLLRHPSSLIHPATFAMRILVPLLLSLLATFSVQGQEVTITPSAPTASDVIFVKVDFPELMLRSQSNSLCFACPANTNKVTVTIDNTGVSFLPNPPGVVVEPVGPLPAGTYTFEVIIQPGAAPIATMTVIVAPSSKPVEGMWWDPMQSGSGYAIDVKHGVLVMTVFSYTATGLPQWYLLYGPLVNNSVTARLLKFTDGQCISCAMWQLPSAAGDDGMATVTFTSPTTGTILLPGGRITQIVPQDF
jgi:hypothetical protein